MTYQQRFIALRGKIGWKQDQLAAALRTSQATIWRIETGQYARTSTPLFALFDRLERDIAEGLVPSVAPASTEEMTP